jgi:hypothetical protein
MKKTLHKKGMALALVLIFMVVIFILAVSVVGLTTVQNRMSLQRNQEIITHQTAIAGLKYTQYKIRSNWDGFWGSEDLRSTARHDVKMLFDGEYYSENKCYFDVAIEHPSLDMYVVTSTAYFREGQFSPKKIWAKGVKVGFARTRFKYALFSLGPGDFDFSWMLLPYDDPARMSMVINGVEVEGDIGTKQKYSKIVVKPKPIIEGEGDDARVKPVNVYLDNFSYTDVESDEHSNVNVIKNTIPLQAPLDVSAPPFPAFTATRPFVPSDNPAPGNYKDVVINNNQTEISGHGKYLIKNFDARNCGSINFSDGEYYIENFYASNVESITFASGKYYFKNLILDHTKLKAAISEERPVYLFSSNSISISNSEINLDMVDKEGPQPNPKFFYLFGTETCTSNTMNKSTANMVFENLSNGITITDSTIDGSAVAKRLEVSGNGKFSCHTSFACDREPQIVTWEEL